ncbi:rhomboid-like intramembrane serine protease [Haladaptatus paucihalophilus DX253]|uniref:Membrane associated serine protease, rhomboid family n=1 Tax=Haladaptatus paucihalophilus DX253 TaxID=797209 RepID=E7QUU9_HALPU|nr:rhomboid family intramembrane serine protease [Haladaptatus paucihalophilus]EFW91756.1 rhomboid-like intramembrane serine protease [Haladaptatus paucihalophilus DX253]SHJ94906.1 Membrane associated serine protease, rhomboid family [Haladaptatus paucihalophilus DX253]
MVSPLDGWPMQLGMSLGLLVSALIVWGLDRPRGRWGTVLRRRLLFGVPWGTLVCVTGVVAVYLFVQDGWNHWYNPVTVAFASWSYLYPLGMLAGPFSHVGPSHLLGNMTSTLAVAPLAEYYFGHYPPERGETSFSSWRTNPWVRAFVLFPLGVVVIALCTGLFSWGPVIGFSGVFFAFAGFALVRYPLGTVVALSAQDVIQTLYVAFRSPQTIGEATTHFSRPWWFGIAVQGHTLGFFLGAVAGVYLLRTRDVRPSALRTWAGGVIVLVSSSLWALWWYRGMETFVLFRGLGVIFVLALATLVALAVRTTDRNAFSPKTRQVGAVLLLIPLIAMAGVAVPINLTSVQHGGQNALSGVSVRGYTVTYAEDVPNQKVSVVDVSVGGETTQVNTSGVIVVNPDREIWSREVSKGQLAYSGGATVRVGGVGWSKAVRIKRTGWSATGGGTAYQVWLRPLDGQWKRAFSSGPATASPVLAGNNVSIVAQKGRFALRLSRNNTTVGTAPMPTRNATVTVDGIRFTREKRRIMASINDTRVQVAAKEQYRN